MPLCNIARRDFLSHAAFGVAGLAALDLMLRDGTVQAALPETAGQHHAARAQHVIHIFLGGGLSQIDSFDYKPELEKYHDREMPSAFGKADPFMGKAGKLHRPHYAFKQRGNSGLWMSELFPHLNAVADELTMINSMVAETANHIPGIYQANTGFRQMGFPAMGAWLSYGLGSISENLPGFVVLPDVRGIPNSAGGAFNWSSGFLPAQHQGVPFNTKGGPPILDLQPASGLDAETQRERLELLGQLNARHLEERVHTDLLAARIHSYELAARMQAAIPEAMDFSSEPEHVQTLYGLDRAECRDTARNCLAARRLIERGVRTVQLWTGDGVSWDAHGDITGNGYKSHTGEALRIDRPVAGLIQDLRQRNLLKSTVVMITTEFGRTPYAQADQGKLSKGRDHHPEGFTNVLAGGGFRPGFAWGATDEIGYTAVENPVTTYDLHATVLHVLGIDHERLTFYHNGIQRRLTNVHGRVVKEILT
jgi:hypothetical protein